MSKQFVVGNWKLHGSVAQINSVLGELAKSALDGNIGICVPFPYLSLAGKILEDTAPQTGAQDVSEHRSGAYTGEVSADMLADLGCKFVIIAHSERRQHFGETTEKAAKKIQSCLDAGLFPIYCVGDNTEQRENGQAEETVIAQLQAVKGLPPARFAIAYEPAWAIGSGVTATDEQISAMHALIKAELSSDTIVLYGGSVKAANASQILSIPGVDGVLVGGAALSAQEFAAICKAVRW